MSDPHFEHIEVPPPTIRYSGETNHEVWPDDMLGRSVSPETPEPILAMHVIGEELYLFTVHGIYRAPQAPPTFPRVIEWRWRVKRWVLERLDRLAAWIRWRW